MKRCEDKECEYYGKPLVIVEECDWPICKSAVKPNGYTFVKDVE